MRGLSFGRNIPQYVVGNNSLQVASPSSEMQLKRLNRMVRTSPIKRTSPMETPRSTRRKPEDSSPRATAMTASYSGVMQTNSTSYTSPTTSFTSSTATHEVSITIERRFVSIETTLHQQQQQQDEMNVKLDNLDETTHESNILIKQMMDNLKIAPLIRGEKRSKPSEAEEDMHEELMVTPKKNP